MPKLTIYRTRFLEQDIHDGDFPRDDVRTEEHTGDVADVVRWLRDEGLTEVHGWIRAGGSGDAYSVFTHPDGTTIVDYASGEREETAASVEGKGAWAVMHMIRDDLSLYRRSPEKIIGEEVADCWDDGDLQSSILSPLFAICTVMSAAGVDIPGEWEYQRGCDGRTLEEIAEEDEDSCDYREQTLAERYLAGSITGADLLKAGTILARMHNLLPEDKRY